MERNAIVSILVGSIQTAAWLGDFLSVCGALSRRDVDDSHSVLPAPKRIGRRADQVLDTPGCPDSRAHNHGGLWAR